MFVVSSALDNGENLLVALRTCFFGKTWGD